MGWDCVLRAAVVHVMAKYPNPVALVGSAALECYMSAVNNGRTPDLDFLVGSAVPGHIGDLDGLLAQVLAAYQEASACPPPCAAGPAPVPRSTTAMVMGGLYVASLKMGDVRVADFTLVRTDAVGPTCSGSVMVGRSPANADADASASALALCVTLPVMTLAGLEERMQAMVRLPVNQANACAIVSASRRLALLAMARKAEAHWALRDAPACLLLQCEHRGRVEVALQLWREAAADTGHGVQELRTQLGECAGKVQALQVALGAVPDGVHKLLQGTQTQMCRALEGLEHKVAIAQARCSALAKKHKRVLRRTADRVCNARSRAKTAIDAATSKCVSAETRADAAQRALEATIPAKGITEIIKMVFEAYQRLLGLDRHAYLRRELLHKSLFGICRSLDAYRDVDADRVLARVASPKCGGGAAVAAAAAARVPVETKTCDGSATEADTKDAETLETAYKGVSDFLYGVVFEVATAMDTVVVKADEINEEGKLVSDFMMSLLECIMDRLCMCPAGKAYLDTNNQLRRVLVQRAERLQKKRRQKGNAGVVG